MTPTRFGSYELLEKIAVGGMAEVFRARALHAAGVTRSVCLKRIHPSLCADPSFVGMFIEEARLGLSLSHGNIVPVFDFGCVDGHHFIVMDYVEGRDLASVMARGRIVSVPFPAGLAAFVAVGVLEGLAYAHGRTDESGRRLELVHRDISPSNVLVSSSGEVKILDFGIARSALREFRTRTGVVKGKPGYMAPEQARGEPVDARADLFACGVLLHELLAGRRPFEDDDVLASEPRVRLDDPLLAEVVLRALAPRPADRFASAREMGSAIADALETAGLRPSAAELADHVERLFGARASTPDWSLGVAVDRHLAAAAPTGEGPEPSPRTEPMRRAGTGEPEGGRPASGGPARTPLPPASGPPPSLRAGRPRRPWLALGAVVAAASATAALAVSVLDRGAERAEAVARSESEPSQPPEPARVEVRTQPAGATVLLDGEEVPGASPVDLAVPPGRHAVEVRLEGHGTLRRSVMARAGQLVAMDVVLQPVAAALVVSSEPDGAAVLLDGEERGRSPATLRGLDPEGSYLLEVRAEGFEPWSRRVSLEGRAVLRVEASLARLAREPRVSLGTLSVNAHPWAEVLVDGRRVGQTPLVGHQLPAGRHRVELRNAARGAALSRVVAVRAGEDTRLVVDLTEPEAARAP